LVVVFFAATSLVSAAAFFVEAFFSAIILEILILLKLNFLNSRAKLILFSDYKYLIFRLFTIGVIILDTNQANKRAFCIKIRIIQVSEVKKLRS
jgi:hypothetical protein